MLQGELRADLDEDLLAEILLGPILVRTVLWDDSDLSDPRLAETMVDVLLAGSRPRGPPRRSLRQWPVSRNRAAPEPRRGTLASDPS